MSTTPAWLTVSRTVGIGLAALALTSGVAAWAAPGHPSAPAPAELNAKAVTPVVTGLSAGSVGNGTLRLRFVTITVSDGPATVRKANLAGYYIKTCVTSLPTQYRRAGSMPISRAPWSLTSDRVGQTHTSYVRETGAGYTPSYTTGTRLRIGQCTTGYVSFRVPDDMNQQDVFNLTYAASTGDRGMWSYD